MSLDHHQQAKRGRRSAESTGPKSGRSSKSKSAGKAKLAKSSKSRRKQRPVVGWREWALLPLLAPEAIQVKIDTGAATSSLHAHDLEIFEVANDLDLESKADVGREVKNESVTIARFAFRPGRDSDSTAYTAEVPVIAFRPVKSSNGQSEVRPVVRTPIAIGTRRFDIDLTLADRDTMGYRMLVGRRALRRRFLVDPGKSYLLDPPDVHDDRSTS